MKCIYVWIYNDLRQGKMTRLALLHRIKPSFVTDLDNIIAHLLVIISTDVKKKKKMAQILFNT
jgi:hypothetical protein